MLKTEHDLHRRRFSRNVGLGVTLALFVVLVFALTVVKVTKGDPMSAIHSATAPQAAAPAAPQTGGVTQ